MVVWMHEDPLVAGRTYIAKHTTRTVRATVRAIDYRVEVNNLDRLASDTIAMNEIAEVEFETNLPLFFDAYRANRITGSLILIDALTNATVGAAMIVAPAAAGSETSTGSAARTSLLLLPGNASLAVRGKGCAPGARRTRHRDRRPSHPGLRDCRGSARARPRRRHRGLVSGACSGGRYSDRRLRARRGPHGNSGSDEEAILNSIAVKL